MLPWLSSGHANPHSAHQPGRRAAAAIEKAKGAIGELIGADPDDIYFTSGATESNNLILQGLALGSAPIRHLVVSAIEHKCVLETASFLQGTIGTVSRIPVDRLGRIDPAAVRHFVSSSDAGHTLVSVMHSNNEIGTVQPIGRIAEAIAGTGALFHSDASQSVGKISVDVERDRLDFLSMSAHKVYGPAGIGAAFIARDHRRQLRPLLYGGGQQLGIRPGTIPLFLAVGFGAACDLARKRLSEDAIHTDRLATIFVDTLRADGVSVEELGDPSARLPGLRSLRFNVNADDLLDRLAPWVSASTGSACTAGELQASHVLSAIGLSADQANQVARFGFGRGSSVNEAYEAARAVATTIRRIHSLQVNQ